METAWIGLVGTVIGGIIGGASGLLAPVLLQRRKEAEERRCKRAEKFEELVAAVYEFDHWVEMRRRTVAYGDTNLPPNGPSPFAKIEAIVAIYFPSLTRRIAALDFGLIDFKFWTDVAGIARLSAGPNWLSLPEFSVERFNEASQTYMKARMDLLSALSDFGKAEFG
jgi:hypothetical protein